MNDQLVIDHLAELLTRDEPVLLGSAERDLVRRALTALAAATRDHAHLERIASIHREALGAVEHAAAGGTDAVTHLAQTVGVAYDTSAAAAAREELERSVDSAASASRVIGAALRFARDATVLVG